MARADDQLRGRVVADRAAGVRAYRVERHERAGARPDHDGRIARGRIGEGGGLSDGHVAGRADSRAGRSLARLGRRPMARLGGGGGAGRGRGGLRREARPAARTRGASGQPAQTRARPPATRVAAATAAVTVPPSTTSRRLAPARRGGAACPPSRDGRVQRQDRAGPGQQQRSPGEREYDVRPGVVRSRVKADRQEQHQGQREAPGRGQPRPESEQGAHAHRQFAERDEDAERDRDMAERRDQRVDRAAPGGGRQLGLDRGRVGGIEEPGVGQLLQAGEAEREPEEGAQREQRAT